jgi:hypothetical protein
MTTTGANDPDFAFEPVPGLPERLPTGEHALWRGSPDAWAFTWDTMRLRGVGIVCALLLAWRIGAGIHDGLPMGALIASVLWTTALCVAVLGVLVTAGQLMARGTIYTVTNKRLVIRHGVAMPMSINIPYSKIGGASVAHLGEGRGSIALQAAQGSRVSFIAAWPHVRPFRVLKPEPMLRAIPEVDRVAKLMVDAIGRVPVTGPKRTNMSTTAPATASTTPPAGALPSS